MLDFKRFAEQTAREAFMRATAAPLTHWTDDDEARRFYRVRCGRTVDAGELTTAGRPPTCPRCRELWDRFQALAF